MKKSTKIWLYVLFVVLLLAIIVVSNVVRNHSHVRGVKAQIDYGVNDTLISAAKIEEQVLLLFPTLTGQQVQDVNQRAIRDSIMAIPYIEHCNVSISIDCHLVVEAVQSSPVMRLFLDGNECYIDRRGRYMPTGDEGDADVLVANEAIAERLVNPQQLDLAALAQDTSRRQSGVVAMWLVACYLYDHPEVGVLFDQVYVNSDRDVVLVPKVGNHIVVVGSPDHLEQKLSDLVTFYRQGLSRVGWETYSQINLKYEGQVICRNRK